MTQTLDSLLVQMPSLRRVIKRGWGSDTVPTGWPYRPGDPVGQCGPTALWVTLFLRSQGFDALFAEGSVTVGGRSSIANHHWTEVEDHIVDLTCSQGEGIPVESIATLRSDLEALGIQYTHRTLVLPQDFQKWKLWQRYELLLKRIGSTK